MTVSHCHCLSPWFFLLIAVSVITNCGSSAENCTVFSKEMHFIPSLPVSSALPPNYPAKFACLIYPLLLLIAYILDYYLTGENILVWIFCSHCYNIVNKTVKILLKVRVQYIFQFCKHTANKKTHKVVIIHRIQTIDYCIMSQLMTLSRLHP